MLYVIVTQGKRKACTNDEPYALRHPVVCDNLPAGPHLKHGIESPWSVTSSCNKPTHPPAILHSPSPGFTAQLQPSHTTPGNPHTALLTL
jgi:hypothetical protein